MRKRPACAGRVVLPFGMCRKSFFATPSCQYAKLGKKFFENFVFTLQAEILIFLNFWGRNAVSKFNSKEKSADKFFSISASLMHFLANLCIFGCFWPFFDLKKLIIKKWLSRTVLYFHKFIGQVQRTFCVSFMSIRNFLHAFFGKNMHFWAIFGYFWP